MRKYASIYHLHAHNGVVVWSDGWCVIARTDNPYCCSKLMRSW